MKPPSRQRSPLLATVRAMASACAGSRNRGSGTSATRSGDADGIEAGDLLPGVRRVGGKPVDMAAQMGHAIRCRPGQRGGRPTLNIRPGPVPAILVHSVDRRQQPACAGRQRSMVNVLSRWAWGSTGPGSVRAPASPTGRESAGRLGSVRQSGRRERRVRQQRLTVGPRRPAVGQRPGRESGAADPDERRARGGNVIVSLLTDPKPEAGILPANSRA